MRLFFVFSSFILVFLLSYNPAEAAVLKLDPVTKSAPSGVAFSVNVIIDTEGEQVTSTDALISYDGSILEVASITSENAFFPDVYQNITPTEIYIGASVINPTEFKQGSGTVATINFRGKKDGSTDAKFVCTAGKTTDSNISKNDKNATDIINCAGLVHGRYTIGSGVGQAPTTAPGVPTSTPIIVGSTETTMGIIAIGVIFLLIGAFTGIIVVR
jgi:hypothetical protein